MPKRSSRTQHPNSPGLAGAASVKQIGSASFPSSDGAELEVCNGPDSVPEFRLNGAHTVVPSGSWTRDLDDLLRESAKSHKDHERRSIDIIRGKRPDIPKSTIWDRIVYLGLTERTRPPYDAHDWTEVEDEILRAEYGGGREGARAATAKILALHPDWTHDAVAWRAQALGVANHRATPPRRWDQRLDDALRELADCKLETIARRLGRSPKSILSRVHRLGLDAGFFGGQKSKDLMRYLNVSEGQIRSWVRSGWLTRKRGRITDESLTQFCREHPELIPFHSLTVEAQNWIRSLGYSG